MSKRRKRQQQKTASNSKGEKTQKTRTRIHIERVILGISILLLIGSTLWFLNERRFEPLLMMIGEIGAIIAIITAILETRKRLTYILGIVSITIMGVGLYLIYTAPPQSSGDSSNSTFIFNNITLGEVPNSSNRKINDIITHGKEAYDSGRYSIALNYFQQARDLSITTGERNIEAAAYHLIGSTLAQQAFELEHHWEEYQPNGVTDIGRALSDEGQNSYIERMTEVRSIQAEALDNFEQAMVIYKELGDRAKEGVDHRAIGIVRLRQQDYEHALEEMQLALEIARELGEEYNVGERLSIIGDIYREQELYDEALKNYFDAENILRKYNDYLVWGNVLGQIGGIYHTNKQYDQALIYYEKALELSRRIGNKRMEGFVLSSIALVYANQATNVAGDQNFEKALELYMQVRGISESFPDDRELAQRVFVIEVALNLEVSRPSQK